MAEEDESPLGPQDLDEMRVNMTRLKNAETQIRKAQSAGIDTVEIQKRLTSARTQLVKLAGSFFPGQPL